MEGFEFDSLGGFETSNDLDTPRLCVELFDFIFINFILNFYCINLGLADEFTLPSSSMQRETHGGDMDSRLFLLPVYHSQLQLGTNQTETIKSTCNFHSDEWTKIIQKLTKPPCVPPT